MNKRKASAHLIGAESYFLITLKGDNLYTDIDINGVGEVFIEAVRDELNKMLEAQKDGDAD